MENGQVFLFALTRKMLSPPSWLELPEALSIIAKNLETDIPIRILPQISYTLFRVGLDGITNRIIDKEMVVPFVSGGGAQVLAPNWDLINPVLLEIFNQ
jgi:hypothetical protein